MFGKTVSNLTVTGNGRMKANARIASEMFRYCEGNGMHLRDDQGKLLVCHYKRLL